MISRQSVCLRRLADGRAQEVKFGRWLANDKVTPAQLLANAYARTGAAAAGRHVLAIQDTSELNYQAHARRVSGLGTVGNGSDLGMFVHPLLAVDAAEGICLGLAYLHQWIRTQKADPDYQRLPIEQKESHRWLEVAQAGKQCLSEAALVTVVADRESDIYEEWVRLPDARTHLLTRARSNRTLATGGKLYEWLDAQPVQGHHEFDVPARAGKRSAHRARLSVRFGRVTIKRPNNCSDPSAPKQIELSVIEVKELTGSVIGNEAPIHWRLLSTHPITCLEDALRCVDWYRQRWHIEQLFRTLKKQGLKIESSQVETAEGLSKLACLAVQAAVRIVQLTLARDGGHSAPASHVFDTQEVKILQRILPRLEGKTQKQKNPHQPGSLAQAAWVVARLGGWKGYASEAKPGPITMHHGLQRLEAICQGWNLLAGDVCID
jgi:Transposase DDE domain